MRLVDNWKEITLGIAILSVIIVCVGWYNTHNNLTMSLAAMKGQLNIANEHIKTLEINETEYIHQVVLLTDENTIIHAQVESLTITTDELVTLLGGVERNLDRAKQDLEYFDERYTKLNASWNNIITKYERMQSGFSTRTELQDWLREDHVSEKVYQSNYNCENFASDLALSAQADGYHIGLLETKVKLTPVYLYNLVTGERTLMPSFRLPWQPDYDLHAKNYVIIGDDIYEVEPQDDTVKLLGVSEYGW